MADLQLKHLTFQGEMTFYYRPNRDDDNGKLLVKDGILVLPDKRVDLLTRAWMRGFRVDPSTGRPYNPEEARAQLSV